MSTNKELLSTIREALEEAKAIDARDNHSDPSLYTHQLERGLAALDQLEAQQADIAKLIEAGDAMAYVLRGLSDGATILASAWHAAKSAAPAQQQDQTTTKKPGWCDYRKVGCSVHGDIIDGEWVCDNHQAAPSQQPRVRYRSQVSGMWYETLEAAGDVDCVEVHGVEFCQTNGAECLTQQHHPKRLTEAEAIAIAHKWGSEMAHVKEFMVWAIPHIEGYIGGLSVEKVMEEVILWESNHMQPGSGSFDILRARLIAKAQGQ